jgi:hypothetical protein
MKLKQSWTAQSPPGSVTAGPPGPLPEARPLENSMTNDDAKYREWWEKLRQVVVDAAAINNPLINTRAATLLLDLIHRIETWG